MQPPLMAVQSEEEVASALPQIASACASLITLPLPKMLVPLALEEVTAMPLMAVAQALATAYASPRTARDLAAALACEKKGHGCKRYERRATIAYQGLIGR